MIQLPSFAFSPPLLPSARKRRIAARRHSISVGSRTSSCSSLCAGQVGRSRRGVESRHFVAEPSQSSLGDVVTVDVVTADQNQSVTGDWCGVWTSKHGGFARNTSSMTRARAAAAVQATNARVGGGKSCVRGNSARSSRRLAATVFVPHRCASRVCACSVSLCGLFGSIYRPDDKTTKHITACVCSN